MIMAWIVFSFIFALICLSIIIFNISISRKLFISKPLFNYFCRILPPLSQTEKEALKSGNIWFEGSLAQGDPDWKMLYDFKETKLTVDENKFLNNQVSTLCSMINAWKIDNDLKSIPKEIWEYLKKEKFFGMIIPKSYGGLGFSAMAHSAVITKIATRHISSAITTMVPNSLGPAELLLHYGTKEQQDYYLPRLANGTDIPCFALTSHEAGSDAGAITDKGTIKKGIFENEEIVGIELNWNKRYITLAPIATLMGLAIKLYDPEHLIGNKTSLGITLCLIPTHLNGIEIGQRHCPLGLSFPNGPIKGKNVFVPLSSLIGGISMAGHGWAMLMESLSAGRGISLPALSVASCMISYRASSAYTQLRTQFKSPIGHFEGIEEGLASIAGVNYILEASRKLTATSLDLGNKPGVVTAISKYHMTEYARSTILKAMDIHGGKAIMMGPKNYLAQIYHAAPISITVEGANILTRNLIIFGQGAIRCHPYVQLELEAAELRTKNEKEALMNFDKLIKKHIPYTLKNGFKWLFYSLTRGRISCCTKQYQLSIYEQRINWLSATLAWLTDLSFLILGGKLKRKERLSARLGDVLSFLYLSSAVLKAYQSNPTHNHYLHSKWALNHLGFKAQEALINFFQNFPVKWLGLLLKYLTFPFGYPFNLSDDKLEHDLAQIAQYDLKFRKQVTHLCYTDNSDDDMIAKLDEALELAAECAKYDKGDKEETQHNQTNENTHSQSFDNSIHGIETIKKQRLESLVKQIIAVDKFNAEMKHIR